MAAFEELGLAPELCAEISKSDWRLPTPIQAEAIPLILGGGDICCASETGTGKTGAFGLPLLQIVDESLRNVAGIEYSSETIAINKKHKFIKLSPDADSMVRTNVDGTECCASAGNRWVGCRFDADILFGSYMFEAVLLEGDIMRVGFGNPFGSRVLGTDDKSYGYGSFGKRSWNNIFFDYGEAFTAGDVIGCYIDRLPDGSGSVSFSKNGRLLGKAFDICPNVFSKPLRPGVCGKNFRVKLHFDDFDYPLKDFKPVSSCAALTQHSLQDTGKKSVLAIVLAPTRELCLQTLDFLEKLSSCLTKSSVISCALLVGGIDEEHERRVIRGVDLCVGVPSKVMSFIESEKLNLSKLRYFVLDEADELFRLDTDNCLVRIKQAAQNKSQSRIQTVLFSATLHSDQVKNKIESLTTHAVWVDLKGKPTIPDTVHCLVYGIDPKLKSLLCGSIKESVVTDAVHIGNITDSRELLSLNIKNLKPQALVLIADKLKMDSCLVFCRTNLDCNNLEAFLTKLGGGREFKGTTEKGKENRYSCVVLAGARAPQERVANLKYFKEGAVRFLICTDVAARGIDINELPFVIMMNIPDEADQFFHRVGRVGRVDKMGLAISIVCDTCEEKVWYHTCKNRGYKCSNRNLVQEGGCTIWYDEPSYLKKIEKAIGNELPRMHPVNFSVKGILDTVKSTPITTDKENTRSKNVCHLVTSIYGRAKDFDCSVPVTEHIQKLSTAVSRLRELEGQSQKGYLLNYS